MHKQLFMEHQIASFLFNFLQFIAIPYVSIYFDFSQTVNHRQQFSGASDFFSSSSSKH